MEEQQGGQCEDNRAGQKAGFSGGCVFHQEIGVGLGFSGNTFDLEKTEQRLEGTEVGIRKQVRWTGEVDRTDQDQHRPAAVNPRCVLKPVALWWQFSVAEAGFQTRCYQGF